jgi:metallo-beta-lactamase class B
LGDANIAQWSNTVERIKEQYPNIKIVIPGHGAIGGKDLLDYTIQLFKNN